MKRGQITTLEITNYKGEKENPCSEEHYLNQVIKSITTDTETNIMFLVIMQNRNTGIIYEAEKRLT